MVGDFGWEHEGTKSGVGTVNDFLASLKVKFGQKSLVRAGAMGAVAPVDFGLQVHVTVNFQA